MTHILCIGDSITDCDRHFSKNSLGNGYVQMLHQQKSMEEDWKTTNQGVNGFTISRLLLNSENYLSYNADIITILIGINDIGLMMNTNRTDDQKSTMLETFFTNYRLLLEQLSHSQARLILMEPFLFPWPAEYRSWFPWLAQMSRGISLLAEEFHLPYVTLHELLNENARMYGFNELTEDGIHLTAFGHKILAQKLLEIL